MLRVFADDSGSDKGSPWCVLAGYVASVEAWDAFEPEWTAALTNPPSIRWFKSTEAHMLDGEFQGFDRAQADAKMDCLIRVIQRFAQRAICVRMKRKHFTELVAGQVPIMWDDPYYFMFPSFVQAAIAMERHGGGDVENIDYVFDSHEVYEGPSLLQYRQLTANPLFAGRVVDVRYRSDREFVPLQAADLLAWQVRRKFSFPREPLRAHHDAARVCARPCFDIMASRDDLINVRSMLDEQAKQLQKAFGVVPSETRQWKDRTGYKDKPLARHRKRDGS